jgi:DNA-binding transcriptional ArsR family regulator
MRNVAVVVDLHYNLATSTLLSRVTKGAIERLRSTPTWDGHPSSSGHAVDPAFKRVLMYLLVGTKGGFNRGLMIKLLKDEPMNANKIGERLALDYKTIQHHLKILQENNIVVTSTAGTYGAMYFLTPYVEKHMSVLEEIWARFGKR